MKKPGDSKKKIREMIVDGIFYPAEPEKLEHLLSDLISEAEGIGNAEIETRLPRIIMVPHAGYEYAGGVMAAGFSALTATNPIPEPKLIVVVAPAHRERRDALFLTESQEFLTPLGAIPVARDLTAHMADCGTNIEINDIPHLEEHSVETCLPFIRYLFPKAELLPIIVGSDSRTVSRLLSGALRTMAGEFPVETLIVVSSNLCTPASATDADRKTESCRHILTSGNYALTAARARGEITMCGAAAMEGALRAMHRVPSSGNSAPETHTVERMVAASGSDDKEPRVWYGAYAFYL